jgi:SAM-dependent methyltransferase
MSTHDAHHDGHHGHHHGHQHRPHLDQRSYPEDLAAMTTWVTHHAASFGPQARVLEIGCGDGALTTEIAGAGFDAIGIDPNAPEGDRLHQCGLEDVAGLAGGRPFDVIVASVSLHHVGDLAGATTALRAVSRAGTVLLVREFDRELIDDPTMRWWFDARAMVHDGEPGAPSFEEFMIGWREAMASHVHPWRAVKTCCASAGFREQSMLRGPYLFRHELGESFRASEQAMIAAGRINEIGILWEAVRGNEQL